MMTVMEELAAMDRVQYEDELIMAQLEPLQQLFKNVWAETYSFSKHDVVSRALWTQVQLLRQNYPTFDSWCNAEEAVHGKITYI